MSRVSLEAVLCDHPVRLTAELSRDYLCETSFELFGETHMGLV